MAKVVKCALCGDPFLQLEEGDRYCGDCEALLKPRQPKWANEPPKDGWDVVRWDAGRFHYELRGNTSVYRVTAAELPLNQARQRELSRCA